MTGVNFHRNARKETAMFPKSFERLTAALVVALEMNKSRAKCFAAIILTAIEGKSVLLADVAKRLPGAALDKSKFHRLQDFYREVRPDFSALARMIMGYLDIAAGHSLVLALDRTGWQMRGGHEYNLLLLCACTGDMGVPILWRDLERLGNSSPEQRIPLLESFINLFGAERVHCLLGDREFVGKAWFNWLRGRDIPFVMRLRNDIRVADSCGRMVPATNLFHCLRVGESMVLGSRTVFHGLSSICAMRLRSGELLVLASHGIDAKEALALYKQRWNIETGFEKLKTHGFHIESSRLHGQGKMECVLVALAIGAAWCHASGVWSVKAIAPIKLKKHGRKEQSIFSRGMALLCSLFHGIGRELRHVSQAVFGMLRRAANAAIQK